jgi:sugar/nucleoside kinase (ribokinase family)
MTSPAETNANATERYDVIAIGNAIVDVIARCDEPFLDTHGMAKGSMQLIDAGQATGIYDVMGQAQEVSGGSAANTLAAMANIGTKCAFIGQVADDQLGQIFAHDIRAAGVDFNVAPRSEEPPTARCLILVTQDGQRTMNTFLGAAQYLPPAAIDEDMIRRSDILYLEGYLWDPEEPRAAMQKAIEIARDAGNRVALTMSDAFVIERHRDGLQGLIDDGKIDILFANEVEILSLTQLDDFEAALAAIAAKVQTLVVTRGEHGAVAIADGQRAEVSAEPVSEVVDTTGAGDLFAAGFLAGQAQGKSLETSLTIGAVAAGEIITHIGPRVTRDLPPLIAQRLG